jgi:hypothetical protein
MQSVLANRCTQDLNDGQDYAGVRLENPFSDC